ncbi:AmpG family muropeptide MFS transporter [Candidatus Electronema sp. PJ]|uniref:AmpG family muropeptide MFS transporter n=1 Tax=Candidatus Electronema sp. PJ TaxID=3401572 RepID=UPI003AA94469
MRRENAAEKSWRETMQAWLHPRVVTMLFFGFSAGIPLLLIFSTLSLWLREAGIDRSTVTYFSWAALGYSFKFVWAPLIDTLPLPFLTRKLGRRRGWLLLAQTAVIFSICLMAMTDPVASKQSLTVMALAAVLLGFSSATQDIVIDAYRIECAAQEMQALLSSAYIAGYRLGMLVAGAGALYIAAWFGTGMKAYNYAAWQGSYLIMASVMLTGVITTLLIPEPAVNKANSSYPASYYLRFLLLFICTVGVFACVFFLSSGVVLTLDGLFKGFFSTALGEELAPFSSLLAETGRLLLASCAALTAAVLLIRWNLADSSMVSQTYFNPVLDFFNRYGLRTALLLLTLIGFYRISDIILGVISNLFYQDLGFSKEVIASVTKTFGFFMTLLGGFLGGTLTVRYGVMRILFLGALLSSLTNLLFLLLSAVGANVPLLSAVIAADNLSAGIASAAFVAFLAGLTSISFTAMQYAIFSSLMTLLPKLLGGYSGTMVTAWGYERFFLATALMGLPVLVLIWLAERRLNVQKS